MHNGKRNDVGLLWAEDNIKLTNNYFSALVQFKLLEKGYTKDQQLREKYLNTVNEDLERGFLIRIKDAHKLESRSEREWHLPHHPVVKSNKPGKICRMLNGAAKPNPSTPAVLTTSIRDQNNDILVVSRGSNSILTKSLTRRLVFLYLVSKVYDPIGLVAPFTAGDCLILKDI